jgi:hypothetical protein
MFSSRRWVEFVTRYRLDGIENSTENFPLNIQSIRSLSPISRWPWGMKNLTSSFEAPGVSVSVFCQPSLWPFFSCATREFHKQVNVLWVPFCVYKRLDFVALSYLTFKWSAVLSCWLFFAIFRWSWSRMREGMWVWWVIVGLKIDWMMEETSRNGMLVAMLKFGGDWRDCIEIVIGMIHAFNSQWNMRKYRESSGSFLEEKRNNFDWKERMDHLPDLVYLNYIW